MSRKKPAIVVEEHAGSPSERLEKAARVVLQADRAIYMRLLAAFESCAATFLGRNETPAEFQAELDRIHGKRPEAN